MTKCKNCEGNGEVEVHLFGEEEPMTGIDTCRYCNGTGEEK